MPDYDFIIDVIDCDETGEDHRLGVRDGHIEMLDHNEEMVRAFMAFNAHEPDCMLMANMFRPSVEEFYKAQQQWSKTVWSNFHQDAQQRISVTGMTLDEIQKRAAKAFDPQKLQAAKKRLAAAKAVMAKYGPRMLIDPEAGRRYSEAAASIPYLEMGIDAAEGASYPWKHALDVVEGWEKAATEAHNLAISALEAVLNRQPHKAMELLLALEKIQDSSLPEPIDDRTWEEFIDAAREQALDMEQYYEE
jgi:hypothetical protein